MQASIVIVVHNHLPYLRGCIRRLLAHTTDHELIVVDNGSGPETLQFVRDLEERGVSSHTIINGENLGYAVGCNQGARLASCRWIVFLHTDCFVTPGWLGLLLGEAGRVRDGFRIGAVVPMTNYANEEFPVYCGRLRSRFVEYKLPNKSCPAEDDVERVLSQTYPDGLDKFAASIGWRAPLVYCTDISSFCTAFAKEVFDECGLFDEGYAARGYEDKDMHRRMQDCGWEAWSAQNCFVHHFGNITSDGDGFCFPEIMSRNRERFQRVWLTGQ